jgi:hypothetical protein
MHGLPHLRDLDLEIDSRNRRQLGRLSKPPRRQPFCACRCFRSELRRVIRALATRTASVRGDCFFGGGAFVSVPAVGIMRNCVGAIEPCSTGCMLIGPGDVGLLLGIMDNQRLPGSFKVRKNRAEQQEPEIRIASKISESQ